MAFKRSGVRFPSPPSGVVRGNSSVGRAQPCQGWGRGFESRFPLSSLADVDTLEAERERLAPLPFRFRNSARKLNDDRRRVVISRGVGAAGVAKSVDARDLKSCGGNPIRVRFPVPASLRNR